MQDNSRVHNASRNMVFGMFLRGYQMLLPFIMRTAIMSYMGMSYLGLNSLFGSVLWVLDMAELGVGAAMVYSMYRPIIDGDTNEICALLNLYRKYYRIIGCVIAGIGLLITPIIPKLIMQNATDGIPDDVNIYVVYLLNLFSTAISYWMFAYKQSVLVAHQRSDIVSKVRLITNTFMYASQLVIVIVFQDYYLYLIASIIQQILTNSIVAYVSLKMYPQYKPVGRLEDDVISKINGRIKDLCISKVGTVIVSSADSIVISAFLGLTMLGIYQNYYYVLNAVMLFVKVIFDSSMSGIGNSILTDSKDKIYKDLRTLTFIVAWIAGMCGICLLCLYQPFMKLWAGEEHTLGFNVVICLVIYFLLDQFNQLFITYKDAAGIWHEDRFRPLITALVNLILNIILVQFIGIYGVILSTVISVVCVGMPWILHNLFSTLFKKNMKSYVISLFGYAMVTFVAAVVTLFACSVVPDAGFSTLILKLGICLGVSNLCMLLAYFKTDAFKEAFGIVRRVLKRG